MLTSDWWSRYFETQYIRQIRSLVEVLEDRLLPAFDHIEAEAEEKEKTELEVPVSDDVDGYDLARAAFETGLAHYHVMAGLRQGLINIVAVALHHLYEQQKMELHRRELLQRNEEKDEDLLKDRIFRQRLRSLGVDVTKFRCWQTLEELRHAANTVKHAEGNAAKKLRSLRPELFVAPQVRDFLIKSTIAARPLFKPLVGDLYISVEDIKRYRDAIEQSWRELSSAISE